MLFFSEHPFAHWAALFEREGVWFQKVLQPKEVADDPQAIASGAWVDVPMSAAAKDAGRKHVRQVAAPVAFMGVNGTPRRPVPTLGEHTVEVLEEAEVPNQVVQAVIAASEVQHRGKVVAASRLAAKPQTRRRFFLRGPGSLYVDGSCSNPSCTG